MSGAALPQPDPLDAATRLLILANALDLRAYACGDALERRELYTAASLWRDLAVAAAQGEGTPR